MTDPTPLVGRLVQVTPEQAEAWLHTANTGNRSLRDDVVTSYVRDMRAGRWRLTGESIKFAPDGRLLDGQHRLAAVVKAGRTVALLIQEGIEPDAQSFIDTGAKRTAADALSLAGERNASLLAAAARLAFHLTWTGEDVNARVMTGELQEFLSDHPTVRDAVAAVRPCWATCAPSRLPSPQSRTGGSQRSTRPRATRSFAAGRPKVDLQDGEPLIALIRRLSGMSANRERASRNAYLALIYTTWNAWREGRTLSRITVTVRDGKPSFPQPK